MMKSCRQCGDLKPLEQYRSYYNGRKGTYTVCLDCERINSRHKYLARKKNKTADDVTEIGKIEVLYEAQRQAGLKPPNTVMVKDAIDLDSLIARYSANAAPPELAKWLTVDLTEEPDYYLDEVYEQLKKAYVPVLKLGSDNLPVYDTRFRETLDQVLARFYDYEDTYYKKGDD